MDHTCPKTDFYKIGIENVLLMGDRNVIPTTRDPNKKRRTKPWYDVQAYSVN
jgi:hypothetical protein